DVDEAAQPLVVVVQVPAELRVARRQVLERLRHRRAGHADLAPPSCIRAQRRGDPDHRGLHAAHRRTSPAGYGRFAVLMAPAPRRSAPPGICLGPRRAATPRPPPARRREPRRSGTRTTATRAPRRTPTAPPARQGANGRSRRRPVPATGRPPPPRAPPPPARGTAAPAPPVPRSPPAAPRAPSAPARRHPPRGPAARRSTPPGTRPARAAAATPARHRRTSPLHALPAPRGRLRACRAQFARNEIGSATHTETGSSRFNAGENQIGRAHV